MIDLYRNKTLARASLGHKDAIERVMRTVALERGWRDETLRSRMDGALSLLKWSKALHRPLLLGSVTPDDVHSWSWWLARRGLSASTIRGYKRGTSALVRAIGWTPDRPPPGDAFRQARAIGREPVVPRVDLSLANSRRSRLRLAALVGLMRSGLSLPDACALRWNQLRLDHACFWRGSCMFALDAAALDAIEALPRESERVIGWTAPTARLRLREVTVATGRLSGTDARYVIRSATPSGPAGGVAQR